MSLLVKVVSRHKVNDLIGNQFTTTGVPGITPDML